VGVQDAAGQLLLVQPVSGRRRGNAQQGRPDRAALGAQQQRAARRAVHRAEQHLRAAQGSEDRAKRRRHQDERHHGDGIGPAPFAAWPKAELHCHLDGAVRPATAAELARSAGITRHLRLVAPADCASQAEYIGYFADALTVLQTEAALERAARELGEDSAAENIDYLEVRWAPLLHLTAGLQLTCHAGEAGEPTSVEEALGLGVERIAHGVIGAREPAIVERIRSEGVVLDLCPTANWKCKAVPRLADHPLPGLVRAGVRCTISTDSRTVAATTLTAEYELAARVLGMSEA